MEALYSKLQAQCINWGSNIGCAENNLHWFNIIENKPTYVCIDQKKILPLRADGLESKVEELAQRLENQTSEVLRLTLELEEYEYKDFGTANESNHNKDDEEDEEGDSDYEYVDDGDGKEPW